MAQVTRAPRSIANAEAEEFPTGRRQITTSPKYTRARLAAGLTRRNTPKLEAVLAANQARQARIEADRAAFLAGLAEDIGERPQRRRSRRHQRRA